MFTLKTWCSSVAAVSVVKYLQEARKRVAEAMLAQDALQSQAPVSRASQSFPKQLSGHCFCKSFPAGILTRVESRSCVNNFLNDPLPTHVDIILQNILLPDLSKVPLNREWVFCFHILQHTFVGEVNDTPFKKRVLDGVMFVSLTRLIYFLVPRWRRKLQTHEGQVGVCGFIKGQVLLTTYRWSQGWPSARYPVSFMIVSKWTIDWKSRHAASKFQFVQQDRLAVLC